MIALSLSLSFSPPPSLEEREVEAGGPCDRSLSLARFLARSRPLSPSLPPSLPLSHTPLFLSLSMKEAEGLYDRSLSLAADNQVRVVKISRVTVYY